MKKILIFLSIIFILIFTGCNNNSYITINNKEITYGKEIYLHDLINIKNGKIKTNNYLIDTYELGNKTITFDYIDTTNNTKTYKFNITIVDNIKPKIISKKSYTIKQGETFDFEEKILCGDNYDKTIKCKIEGSYDINKVGEYNLKFIATDSNNNYTEKSFQLNVVKDIPKSSPNPDTYKISDLIKKHKNSNTMIGIDVSSWQENINWVKVKNSGVQFAMIRIGFGHNDDGNIIIDKTFKNNLKNAKNAGIKVGLYFYSYAKNEEEAKEQAKWIIKTLNGEKLDLPIAFDWEDWNNFKSYNINFVELNNIAKAFMDEIINNNYDSMIYGSATYLEQIWDLDNYETWLAHYTDKTDYNKKYKIWQLSSSGEVLGINGNVDLNILYVK